MAEFGWAFIECSGSSSGSSGGACDCAQGPDGALQFHTGSGGMSGSARLTWDDVDNELYLSGTLSVSGTINADVLNVNELNVNTTNKTVVNIEASGSTKFGDTSDDTHQFTGSVSINGDLDVNGDITTTGDSLFGNSIADTHVFSGSVEINNDLETRAGSTLSVMGNIKFKYNHIVGNAWTVQDDDIIIGIDNTSAVTITLPTAISNQGRMLFIKDETNFSAETPDYREPSEAITISASSGQSIDDSPFYDIENGNYAAVTLYSDGSNWYIL